jgi:peptide chain release factor 1
MANNTILRRIASMKMRFEEVSQLISDPAVMADMKRYVKLNKEYSDLEKILKVARSYELLLDTIATARQILNEESDADLREMAKMELEESEDKVEAKEEEIKMMMVPPDKDDNKNVVLEIRAGTGGDEASIFAGDLFRMYVKYCESKGWRVEVTHFNEGSSGGYKEVVFNVTGENVYGLLKYESGVHRVQRIPQTETQGRVHTSAATVAVLPEAEEVDVVLRNEDIRRDEYCSSGPGGQSVNTTYSAIRLTHIPTGVVVTCQDQKSKLKNLDKAMAELRTRLYNLEYQKRMDEIAARRKTLVSTGDRSAKIRTYNYPQGRVTDHRINFTVYNLPTIMDGDIQDFIDKLMIAENSEKLKEVDA